MRQGDLVRAKNDLDRFLPSLRKYAREGEEMCWCGVMVLVAKKSRLTWFIAVCMLCNS